MSEKSLLSSMVTGCCPQCRQDKLFEKGPYTTGLFDMRQECRVCGLQYEREPGFFYGAMYVSYALNVAIFLTVGFILYYLFGNPDLWVYIVSVTCSAVLLYPIIYRLSRSIFLHVFAGMDYKPEKAK